MTWKPEPGMTQRQIDKELNRQAVMFEEACMHGYKASAVKFEELSEEWFENYAKNALRSTTYERMLQLTHRVYPAIGHLRIDKITARHLQGFVNSCQRGSERKDGQAPRAENDTSQSQLYLGRIQLCGENGLGIGQSVQESDYPERRGQGEAYLLPGGDCTSPDGYQRRGHKDQTLEACAED